MPNRVLTAFYTTSACCFGFGLLVLFSVKAFGWLWCSPFNDLPLGLKNRNLRPESTANCKNRWILRHISGLTFSFKLVHSHWCYIEYFRILGICSYKPSLRPLHVPLLDHRLISSQLQLQNNQVRSTLEAFAAHQFGWRQLAITGTARQQNSDNELIAVCHCLQWVGAWRADTLGSSSPALCRLFWQRLAPAN